MKTMHAYREMIMDKQAVPVTRTVVQGTSVLLVGEPICVSTVLLISVFRLHHLQHLQPLQMPVRRPQQVQQALLL